MTRVRVWVLWVLLAVVASVALSCLDWTTLAGITAKLLTPVFGPVPGEVLGHVSTGGTR
jgi:hypothetical protein